MKLKSLALAATLLAAFAAPALAQIKERTIKIGTGITEDHPQALALKHFAEVVAAKAERLVAAMEACGCTLNNAYMQHSLLALVVIPELRISDVGLVDVRTFEKVDLFL